MTQETERQCPQFSMEEWIGQEDPHKDDPEHCRPCRLGVIAQWYHSELKEQGHEDLAAVIEQVAESPDPDMPLTLCKEFDIIKAVVEEPLRERLKDFDCATQSFNPNDVGEDSAAAEITQEEGAQDGQD